MRGPQMILSDVGVDLRRSEVGVAEHRLHRAQVRAMHEHKALFCQVVSQFVWLHDVVLGTTRFVRPNWPERTLQPEGLGQSIHGRVRPARLCLHVWHKAG